MYKKIAVSNRKIFSEYHDDSSTESYAEHLAKLCEITDFLILREKDLSPAAYTALADVIIRKCKNKKARIILHTFTDCCRELDCMRVHLSLPIFAESLALLNDFETVGVSVHSVDEAIFAQSNNASYIVYSHIFQTDCKKGLPPKGLTNLEKVCKSVNIPVYALGGINDENESSVIAAGAAGVCRMSDYMKCR